MKGLMFLRDCTVVIFLAPVALGLLAYSGVVFAAGWLEQRQDNLRRHHYKRNLSHARQNHLCPMDFDCRLMAGVQTQDCPNWQACSWALHSWSGSLGAASSVYGLYGLYGLWPWPLVGVLVFLWRFCYEGA